MTPFSFNYYNLPEKTIQKDLDVPDITIIGYAKDSVENNNGEFIQKVLDSIKFEGSENKTLVLETKNAIPYRYFAKKCPKLKVLISFGWQLQELQLQIDHSKKGIIYLNGNQIILAPDTRTIIKDQKVKRDLWDLIRKIDIK